MPRGCRANKRSRRLFPRIAASWLLLALSLAVAQAANQVPAAAPPASGNAADDYGRCLKLAHDDPNRALTQATSWHSNGGGFPAEHCEAVALVGLKRYAEAAKELQALAGAMMTADPQLRADALDQAGQAWLLADKPEDAKAAFDGALGFKPDDPDILIDRAEAYAAKERYFDAIDDLNRVIDIAPDRADALIYRASAYRKVDSLDLARDDVERALKLAPDAVPGLLERGNIRSNQGDLAGAKADWQRVAALAPNSPAGKAALDNLAHLAAVTAPPAAPAPKQ